MNLKPIRGTGVYAIKELTADVQSGTLRLKKGQRYLENITAGTIAFPSQQAFGVWGQNIYKGADANVRDWLFMASVIDNAAGARQSGYFVRLGSDEKFYLYKTVNGTTTALITSASTYSNSTWYDVSISRTNVGLFTLYINNVSIGTATDLTFLSSNFTIDDWDAGDRGTNYLYKDGIKQN